MLNISTNTLNILQFKDVSISPYIEIKSTTGYVYRLSTDADIIASESEDVPAQGNDIVYPLIQKLPKVRQSIDITNTRTFSVTDLRISILDTEWDNFKFGDVLKDHPIYNQPLTYYLWPRTVDFNDKISIYEGFITNIRKQGNYLILTVKDNAGVSDKLIPRKRINQSELEFNKNHGKPIPFAYGACNAYAMLTDVDNQDMNCQCDTKDQYQNIKDGPINNDESTEVLKISSTEEGYYRIRKQVSAPGGGIGEIIVGNWCNVNVDQYENKPWGCVISGQSGSPFKFNTLFTSYRATSLGGGTFCDFVLGPSYETYDNVFNYQNYGIKYRPATIQGLDELNDTGSGYVYIENYDADNSTDENYNYGIVNSPSGQNDYRIGLNINFTQPTLSKALSNASMTDGIHASFDGNITAGFTNTEDENQMQNDTGKLISFRVQESELNTIDDEEDEGSATNNPVIHQAPVVYNASEDSGIGYSSNYDQLYGEWNTGMTRLVSRPIGGLYIDLKEQGNPSFQSSMWLSVSWVVIDYRFFFEDVREEQFFIETEGRLDTMDHKYTGGNVVTTAYTTSEGQVVLSKVRYANGNKKIPVQKAYNRSQGLNYMDKISRNAIDMTRKTTTRTSPGKHIKNKLTKKKIKYDLDILDSKTIIKPGSTVTKKGKY